MIQEVKPNELNQIHSAIKKITSTEKKSNGYTKHVLKTIKLRQARLEKEAKKKAQQ